MMAAAVYFAVQRRKTQVLTRAARVKIEVTSFMAWCCSIVVSDGAWLFSGTEQQTFTHTTQAVQRSRTSRQHCLPGVGVQPVLQKVRGWVVWGLKGV